MEKNIQTKEKERERENMKRQVSFGSLLKEMNIDVENKTSEELEDAVIKRLEEGDITVTRKNVEETWDNKYTLDTFNDWINVSAHKIACLDLIIQKLRWRLQNYILLGLILSTASGTVSVTQFGSYDPEINFVLNLIFTIMSFAVAILTGAVKTFKIQENLEEYINLKQNWIAFSARITSEIYLPKRLRTDAEFLIKDSKTKFLDLLKIDVPVPKHMLVLAAKNVDKGDSLHSQYYEYLENKHKLERELQGGCMPCLSLMFDCCRCMYSQETKAKIIENKELAKKIKFSKIDNAKKYKQKAYQYTLSSIMLNGVKTEVDNFAKENQEPEDKPEPPSSNVTTTSESKSKKTFFSYLFGDNEKSHYEQQYSILQKQIQDLQAQLKTQQEKLSQQYITQPQPSHTSQSQSQSNALTLQIEETQQSISSLDTLASRTSNNIVIKNDDECDESEDEDQISHSMSYESSDSDQIWTYKYC